MTLSIGAARTSREHRARSLAVLFFAGGSLSSLCIVLPGWPAMNRVGMAASVVAAMTGAVLLWTLAQRLDSRAIHGFLVSGAGLIGVAQAYAGGGSATAAYATLYVWVALHVALYFSPAALAVHIALTTVAHASALLLTDGWGSAAPQLALTIGTQIAASVIVVSLATRLRRLAETDSLTGLGNRRLADRAMQRALERARTAAGTCVAVLDLDGFKPLNDAHGHAAGDRVLIAAARAWRTAIRRNDTLTRTGGDEFTLILPDCDREQAERIVRRMLAATPAEVTCSAGLARWDGDETPQELVGRADRALYLAKQEGVGALASA